MNPETALNDSDLEEIAGGRKLTEVEKWSLRVLYISGIGAAAFSATADSTMKGGAKMLWDAVFNDGEISPVFSFKFFGRK